MRIFFLTYSFLPAIGGVERSVFNLATHLIESGHDVTVVTHEASTRLWKSARHDRVPIIYLSLPAQSPWNWALRLRTLRLNLINAVILIGLCKWKQIEIVHCHHLNVDTYYARILSRIAGIKFVLTLRGGETEEWIVDRPSRQAYVATLLRAAHRITAVSQALIDHAARLVPEIRAKAVVIPNPVDPQRLAKVMSAAPPRDPSVPPYLLFAGRLETMKNVESLIDGFHRVIEERPEFEPKLLLVGGGSLEEPLKQRARGGPGCNRIEFLGPKPYDVTLRLIRDALVVILPSQCCEGCPNVVLEAMALRTPVIVSNLAALTEMVDHGATGRVFALGDCETLKECILSIADDADRRARCVAAAAERVATRCTFESVSRRYLELYDGLIRDRGQQRPA